MTPTFDGARAKIDRSLKHLQDLDAEIKRILGNQLYGIGGHYKPETAEIDLYALGGIDGEGFPLVDWGLYIGDCLQNLRSALDHVAWQLALTHMQREPTDDEARRIQFPIEDIPSGFKSARVRPYVSGTHMEMFERFQPYQTGDAPSHRLAVLRRLSNIDKHRVVHAAAVLPVDFKFEFHESSEIVSHGEIEFFYGEPLIPHHPIGRIHDVVAANPTPHIQAYGPFSVGVAFDQPDDPVVHNSSVAQILGQIGDLVLSMVNWFERELAPTPPA